MKKIKKWLNRGISVVVLAGILSTVVNPYGISVKADINIEKADYKEISERTQKSQSLETVESMEMVTSQPEETNMPQPTETVIPQPTETVIPQPTETATPHPTETVMPQPTETATQHPTETVMPQPTETATPHPAETVSPKPTQTAKPTPQPTATPKPQKDNTPFKISVKKASKNRLVVSWSKRKAANKYTVWQKKQGGKKWRAVKSTKSTKYYAKVSEGKYYKFKITAIGDKRKTIAKTEKITACIPEKAQSITYKRTASRKISISWKRGKCTKSYIVLRKAANGKYKEVAKVKKAKYKDNSVAIGKKYRYRIVPVYNNKKVKIYGSNTYIGVLLRDEINTKRQNYSYSELSRDIEALQKLYGNHFHYNVIGKSADGRNIYDIVIGNQNASQSILVVSALHAREYMTSQLCMKQIEYYLQNYSEKLGGVKVSDVLNKVAVHYVPMANPDGVAISQYGFSAIRNKKLRSKLLKMPGADEPSLWKANARGVDLNKNYPYSYVARLGRRGSEGYTGPKKCSEPETRAIIKLINSLKKTTTVKGQINYHATGSIIFGEYEGPLKSTITNMYSLACEITGYTSAASYKGDGKSIGNLREFVMYKKKLPSITLEIGTVACPLPVSQFNDIWKKNRNLVLKEAKMLSNN